MALPNTGITTTLVGTTLGVATRNAGNLFLHQSVNEWGFNLAGGVRENIIQEQIWGKPSFERQKLSPIDPNYEGTPYPGYHLGNFRGYDHDWVVYLNDYLGSHITSYEDPMTFDVVIRVPSKLAGKPVPVPAVEHIFKLEFARHINHFDLGTATVISSNFIVTHPSSSFQIEALYPPDYSTNGSLAEGQAFYIKVTHLSSPERRWIPTPLDTHIFQYTTPASSFTNTLEYRNFNIIAVKKTTNPKITVFRVIADLYADYSSQQIVNFTGTMSTTSDYSSNVYNLFDNAVVINQNTTPGTATFVKQLSFDFSSSGIANTVTVGNTVYGKIVASLGQTYVGSAIVTNKLPIDM